jgi:hypothetical protein
MLTPAYQISWKFSSRFKVIVAEQVGDFTSMLSFLMQVGY